MLHCECRLINNITNISVVIIVVVIDGRCVELGLGCLVHSGDIAVNAHCARVVVQIVVIIVHV